MSNEKFNLSNDQVLQQIRNIQQVEGAESSNVRTKLLICQLNGELFGIDSGTISEISRVGLITRVPHTPNYVLGVVNLRGNVTAVIDVRDVLGLERRSISSSGRIVVCQVEGVRVGIIVEAVSEVIEVNNSKIEPPLLTVGQERSLYSTGVIQYNDQIAVLLNIPVIIEKLKV